MKLKNVNAHLHTPYSFSAFSELTEALDRAVQENVAVVGINDFYTTAGYEAWNTGCAERKLYPLFNIEFISLNTADQQAGLRVNDPGNPGRTYLSGKALAYPFRLASPYAEQLAAVQKESNEQVEKMYEKLNRHLSDIEPSMQLDLEWIKTHLTKGSLRERHLATALRLKVNEAVQGDALKAADCMTRIFGGKALQSDWSNAAAVENEIRGNLLKAGGAAFVPEEPTAFLPMETVCQIILAAGGIPTYPFLADDAKGNYTDFEGDLERVADQLEARGFASVEFITTRNDVVLLERYASYLHDRGFVVTFGSEHNSPAMEPIELFARHGKSLNYRLKQINYEGACVLAAHQHLLSQGLPGYVDANGKANKDKRNEYILLGNQVIEARIK